VINRLFQRDFRSSINEASETALSAGKTQKSKRKVVKTIIGHNCKEPGHITPKCPKLSKQPQANAISTCVAMGSGPSDRSQFIMESRCSTHQVTDKGLFSDLEVTSPQIIRVANNDTIASEAAGKITVKLKDDLDGVLRDVMLVPSAAAVSVFDSYMYPCMCPT